MKRGVYTKQGTKYEVYEISKSSYYRLEIHKKGGRLFLDVDTIVYGRFSQKGQTFEYGDRDIYDSWMTFMMQSSVVKAQIDVKEEWLAGDFTETKTRINIPAGLQEEIIERNGKLTSMTTVYKDSSYAYVVESDPATTGKPINFEQYKNIQLSEPVTDAAYYDMDYLRAKYDLSHLDEYDFESIKGATIFVDEYMDFTPAQYLVIEKLIYFSKNTNEERRDVVLDGLR